MKCIFILYSFSIVDVHIFLYKWEVEALFHIMKFIIYVLILYYNCLNNLAYVQMYDICNLSA